MAFKQSNSFIANAKTRELYTNTRTDISYFYNFQVCVWQQTEVKLVYLQILSTTKYLCEICGIFVLIYNYFRHFNVLVALNMAMAKDNDVFNT